MRELIRLTTPPGGVVLDPFAGSGTTAEAAVLEEMRCIAVEKDPTYLPLIEHRMRRVLSTTNRNQDGRLDDNRETPMNLASETLF